MYLDSLIVHLATVWTHAKSLERIQVHKLLHNAPSFCTHLAWVLYFAALYLSETFEVAFAFPWWAAHFHIVNNKSKAPKVRERSTLTALYHLWSQEVRRANKGVPALL